MKKINKGDTLIEVLFAFAILATITGFAFTAAIQGYKNSVQAQNQTQSTFLAQYYADGLKTYRDSLDWTGNALTTQTFLDGFVSSAPSIPSLPDMRKYVKSGDTFCVIAVPQNSAQPNSMRRWVVQDGSNCGTEISKMASNLQTPTLEIRFSDPVRFDETSKTFVADDTNPDKITATVRVGYDIPNAEAKGEVVNTITLTKER